MKTRIVDVKAKSQRFAEVDVTESVFASSGLTVAIPNRAPILPGHCLVLPTRTVAKIGELNEVELEDFFAFAREITSFLVDEFLGEGFDWSLQEGVVAGQSVDHVHLHVIPRKMNDLSNPGDWYPLLAKSNESSLLDSEDRTRLSQVQVSSITKELRSRVISWSRKK